ncbi:MAG: 50S ribosomal protein L31e [Nanobdellota archaeon]
MAKKEETKVILERSYTIPLRQKFLKAPLKKRAKKATSAVREFLIRHMKSDDVRLGENLNNKIWERGIQSPPHKIKVDAKKYNTGVVHAELEGHTIEVVEEAAKKEKTETKEEADKKTETTAKTAQPKKTEANTEKSEEAKEKAEDTEESKKAEETQETTEKAEDTEETEPKKKETTTDTEKEEQPKSTEEAEPKTANTK